MGNDGVGGPALSRPKVTLCADAGGVTKDGKPCRQRTKGALCFKHSDSADRSPLTAKQQQFVEEYLVDLNATQAAVRAGYSRRAAAVIAAQNLVKPNIAAELQGQLARRSQRTQITADRVLQELACIGFADIREMMSWDEDRVRFVPSAELSDNQAAAVAEVFSKTTRLTDRDDNETIRHEMRIKVHDKLGALEKMARHLGLYVERAEHPGRVTARVREMSDEELVRRLGELAMKLPAKAAEARASLSSRQKGAVPR